MNPQELLNPEGRPCGVYVCGKCGTVLAKDLAEKCCKPCDCGKESTNRFQAECWDCTRERIADRMRKRLEEAEEIEWDGEMMLLSEDLPNSRDGWYSYPDEAAEAISWRLEDDPDFEPPQFAFASEKRVKGLDLDSAIETMMDDTYEDAEWPSNGSTAELQKHVNEFNSEHSITFFEPDYKHKIRIPFEIKGEE